MPIDATTEYLWFRSGVCAINRHERAAIRRVMSLTQTAKANGTNNVIEWLTEYSKAY